LPAESMQADFMWQDYTALTKEARGTKYERTNMIPHVRKQ